MKLILRDLRTNLLHEFINVELYFEISKYRTSCKELKDTLFIKHYYPHGDQFRLYKDVKIVKVDKE